MAYLTNISGTQLTTIGGGIISNLAGDDLITDGGTTNYYYNFTDNDGLLWRIEFYDRTYLANTSWTELKGNGANLRWNGAQSDTYQAIVPAELTVSLALNTESRAMINKVITGYDAQFAVVLLQVLTDPIDHDDPTTYSRKWNGVVMQDTLSIEDAGDYEAYITVTATDGFGLLRDIKYIGGIMGPVPDPYTLNDWRSYRWRSLFSGCLWQLPFYGGVDDSLLWGDESTRFYSCASTWYEDSQESSPTDDPLDNIYLSESAFVKVDNYGVDEGMNLYDMLTYLLEMFNLTVKQWDGTFLVIQDNINTQSQTRAWHYGYQNNSLIETELIDLQYAYDLTKRSNGVFTHLLPVKKITTNYDYRNGVYSNNLLPQIVSESVTYLLGVSEAGTQLRLKGRINITYVADPYNLVTDDLCIVFKLRVHVGDFYLSSDEFNTVSWIDDPGEYARIVSVPFNGATSTHVVADFNWLTPEFVDDTTVIASKDMVIGTRYKILTLGDTNWNACGYVGTPVIGGTFTCTAPASSVAVGTVQLYYAAGGYDMEMDWELLQWEVWAIPPTGTPYTPVGTMTIGYAAESGTWIFQVFSDDPMQSTQLHAATVVNSAKADYQLPDSIFGDGIFSFLAGQIQVWDGSNLVNSDEWTIYSEIGETGLPLNSLRVKEMMALRRSTVQFFEGEFTGVPDIHKGFTWETYNWAWRSIDWNIAAGLFTGVAMRVSVNRLGITIETPLIAQDGTSSNGNSTPSQITQAIPAIWKRSGSDIIPKNSGDTLVIPVAEFGDGTNYASLTETGLELIGDATVYNDINTGINPRNTGTGMPTLASFVGGLSNFQFAVNDYADLAPIELLHDWKEGSTIELHLHWATGGTNDTTVRGVKWQIEYSIANMIDNGVTTAFAAITPVSTESSIPSGQAAYTHRYTSVATVTMTGYKIGTQLCMQVKRIASVTNTAPVADPYLLSIGIHYEIDTLGSRERGAK